MGGGNLTAVFCDTGWEHPDTYKHVNDVCLQMGVKLITLKSKYDFVSLAAHKKRFPSTNARFCTLWTLKSRLRVSTTGNLKAAVFSHTVNPFVI